MIINLKWRNFNQGLKYSRRRELMRFNQKRTQLVKDQSQISSNRTTSIIRPMRKNENKKNVKWILLKKN